jgi:hypothetical protein
MTRFAFTLAVNPGDEAAVAGILAYYLPSGATLSREGRIVHVVRGRADLDELAVRLSGRSGRAPITRALSAYRDGTGDVQWDDFLTGTVMERYDVGPPEPAEATDGHPCALLYRVRRARGQDAAQVLQRRTSGMRPGTGTVFRRGDVIVRFWDSGGDRRDGVPPELAPGARDSLRMAGLLDPPIQLTTDHDVRAFVSSSTMTLLAVSEAVDN